MTATCTKKTTTSGSEISWNRFKSGNVLTTSFWGLEMTKSNKGSIKRF